MVLWLANQNFNAVVGDHFPEGESWNWLFHSDIVNLLLKTNEGQRQKAYFSYFVA